LDDEVEMPRDARAHAETEREEIAVANLDALFGDLRRGGGRSRADARGPHEHARARARTRADVHVGAITEDRAVACLEREAELPVGADLPDQARPERDTRLAGEALGVTRGESQAHDRGEADRIALHAEDPEL